MINLADLGAVRFGLSLYAEIASEIDAYSPVVKVKLSVGEFEIASTNAAVRSCTILFMTNSNRSICAALARLPPTSWRGLTTRASPPERALLPSEFSRKVVK